MKILAFKPESLINPNLTCRQNKTKQPQSSNIYNELRTRNACGSTSDVQDTGREVSGVTITGWSGLQGLLVRI